MATLSPGGEFWYSRDGRYLAVLSKSGIRVVDASRHAPRTPHYLAAPVLCTWRAEHPFGRSGAVIREIERTGVYVLAFSSTGAYLVSWEQFKGDSP